MHLEKMSSLDPELGGEPATITAAPSNFFLVFPLLSSPDLIPPRKRNPTRRIYIYINRDDMTFL